MVGFVFDELGRSRGGISQTVNANLTPEDYQRALASGLGYTASTQLPPGYYQVRLVVREAESGNVGTVSRYFEVPDLSNKRLTASSLFLYAVNPGGGKDAVQQLGAMPRLTRKQELRYAVMVYNAKAGGGQSQLRTQLSVSQNGKVLFQEPEQQGPRLAPPCARGVRQSVRLADRAQPRPSSRRLRPQTKVRLPSRLR